MGIEERIEGVRADVLPEELRERMGLTADDRVTVMAEREAKRKPTPEEKRAAIKRAQERIAALPVLREGTDDEIVGYNEFGHFD